MAPRAGEYGPLLKDHTLREQFALLQLRFASAPSEIKASLLSAYLKMQVILSSYSRTRATPIKPTSSTQPAFTPFTVRDTCVATVSCIQLGQ